MRLLVLAFLCVVAVSYSEVRTVPALILLADTTGAPFTTEALERMHNMQLWGAKRAQRSLDLVIVNKLGISLEPVISTCSRGLPSAGLEAENLNGRVSTVLGFQSADDDEFGYMNCHLSYKSPSRKSEFSIYLSPSGVRGDVAVDINASADIDIMLLDSSVDTYNNNEQFIVEVLELIDDNSDPPVVLSQQGATLATIGQRKPKGSRNMFVKASKRGTIIRRI